MKVLEYERGTDDFLKLVSESKYAKWPNFGTLEKGQILLHDHGDRVAFKNFKIKSYKPYDIKKKFYKENNIS
tara:strand:- start:927 stop:1142 length:216 start_codon:yes stop_codon:yes gene_type:complete